MTTLVDVGGRVFRLTRPIVDFMAFGDTPPESDDGTLFVDRDPAMFGVIVDYAQAVLDGTVAEFLTTLGKLPRHERMMVRQEAVFYALPHLADFVRICS